MIKTWQEREFEKHGYVAVSPASNAPYMQAEINELHAELNRLQAQKPCLVVNRCNIEGDCTCGINGVCAEGINVYLAAGAKE